VAISVTLFTDPACPWGYCANPQFRVLEWRYGDQLEWRLVLIGLREEIPETMQASFDGARVAERLDVFRQRYGMPFSRAPKARAAATGRACRLVVAARLTDPGSEWAVLRALQLANFTMPVLLDDDQQLRTAVSQFDIDAEPLLEAIDDPRVEQAYQRGRAEARTAAGTPIEFQGKASSSDGPVRYTAPSVIFERDSRRLDAGGWQPTLSYDTCIANLDPSLDRESAPETPEPLLARFPTGLTTAEVAMLMATGPDEVPDLAGAAAALELLVTAGTATRQPIGHDAIWRSPTNIPRRPIGQSAKTAAESPVD
jgi:2-hydroxychromene-2-carboxylate isomerase